MSNVERPVKVTWHDSIVTGCQENHGLSLTGSHNQTVSKVQSVPSQLYATSGGVNISAPAPLGCGLRCGMGHGSGCAPLIAGRNSANQTVSGNLSTMHVCVPYDRSFVKDSVSWYVSEMNVYGHSSSVN